MATKIEVKGKENISNNQKYFVVSSHQSIFETFFLQTIFDKSSFYTKERTYKNSFIWMVFKKNGMYSD